MSFLIRQATESDADDYLNIETDAYSEEFLESRQSYLAKLRVFPVGCKIVEFAAQSVAYMISHPWTYENPPQLNPEGFTLPMRPNVFFIHSVTIMRAFQNQGIGSALAGKAIEIGESHGFVRSTLISVQNSVGFWERIGFSVVENPPNSVAKKLIGYGISARFMAKGLGSSPQTWLAS